MANKPSTIKLTCYINKDIEDILSYQKLEKEGDII